VSEAVKEFCKMMQWRLDNDVDNALKTWTFDVEKIHELRPHRLHRYDMSGRPVYWEELGKTDASGLESESSVDELVRYHIFHWEYITQVLFPIASKKAGSRIDQILTICDVAGISAGLLTANVLLLLGKVAEIDQHYYPETGFKMYLVNAPWLFSTIWPMLSGFISPQGQEKIEIVYGSPAEKLLEHIDPDNLPECYEEKVVMIYQMMNSCIGVL